MSERDGYRHGVPCWVDTWQPDADAAVGFYTPLFGWEAEDTMPEAAPGKHYICRLRGRDVAAIAARPQAASDLPTAWTTYVWVDDVGESVAAATEAGGEVVIEPFEALDGGRIAVIVDPSGAALGLWQPGAHKGAQLVNEPGAYSMSQLMTADAERAADFYARLFGWTPEPFEIEGATVTMFRLPGYVGGEPEQPVSREVVATMGTLEDGAEQHPHWAVDFWVEDADEAAERAGRAGGTVLAGPLDFGPIMRRAVIADPAGATFSATALKLPASGRAR